jgi:hypothetical protein
MYGRANIFNREVSTTNNASNGGNNYQSGNNNYGSSNNSYGGNTQVGSYRLEYKFEEPPTYITSVFTQWRDFAPSSIVTKEQVLHLSITEFRTEDYFLIRKKQLKSLQEERVRDAIRK